MKKVHFIVMGLFILMSLCLIGCDDEDPIAPCPSPKFYADGMLSLSTTLYMNLYLYNIGGGQYLVDSVKVNDTLCYLDQYWMYAPGDMYAYAYYNEPSETDYSSGDEVTVTVYSGSESSSASVTLLHPSNDEIDIINPSTDTTILTGSSLEIVWEKCPFAEWYAIMFYVNYDSAGSTYGRYVYTYATDTSYYVPASFADEDNNYYDIMFYPVTGPSPTSSTGNWTGDLVTGKLWSYANGDSRRITITNMVPITYSHDSKEISISPQEVIKAVYEAYK